MKRVAYATSADSDRGRPIVPVEIAQVTLTPGLQLSLGGQHRLFMHRMEPAEFRRKLERERP